MLKLIRDFLTLGSLATVAAVVGIGTSLYSAYNQHENSGGGGGGGGGAPGPTGGDVGTADNAWQQLLSQMMSGYGGQAGALEPYLMNAFQSGQIDTSALQGLMRGWGGTLANQSGTAYGRGNDIAGAGAQLWRTAQDPENALRDRTQQRIVDASRAGTSARGIGMSDEAAGIENQAVGNFNLDWNDRQLGRQAQGLSGYSNALNQAGQQSQLGNADLVGAQSMYSGATAAPFNFANLFSGALGQGIYGPAAGIMGQIDPYIGLGQSGQQNAFAQGQTNLNSLTTGLQQFGGSPGYSWLANYFSPNNPSNNNYGMPGGSGGYGEGYGPT